ncbi:MAG TPA: DUF721 domain-containing protein [Methylomirabilota bacterium]|nr:DUF721 domain-containing protein [Methylomirabilota bacterium]
MLPPRRIPPLGPPKRSARQRALAELRGIDVVALEQEKKNTARALSAVMPAVLSQLRMERRQSEAEILRVWQDVLDPRITAHARPVSYHRGTLFVAVDSSVWLDEIVRYRRREIIDRLQHCFGRELIKKISFRLG